MRLFNRKSKQTQNVPVETNNNRIKFDLEEYDVVETIEYEDIDKNKNFVQHVVSVRTGLHHVLYDERLSEGYESLEYLNNENRFKGKRKDVDYFSYIIGSQEQRGKYSRIDKWEEGNDYTLMESANTIVLKTAVISADPRLSEPALVSKQIRAAARNSKTTLDDKYFFGKDASVSRDYVAYTDFDGKRHYLAHDGKEFVSTIYDPRMNTICSEYSKLYKTLSEDLYNMTYPRIQHSFKGSEALDLVLEKMNTAISKVEDKFFAEDEFVDAAFDMFAEQFNERIDLVDGYELEELQTRLNEVTQMCAVKRQRAIDRAIESLRREQREEKKSQIVNEGMDSAKAMLKGKRVPQTAGDLLVEEIAERHNIQKGGE